MASLENKITAIKAEKSLRIKRSKIFLDGRFAVNLENAVILREKLKVGQTISEEELVILTGADRFERCLNSALLFLGNRPRSEVEIRKKLEKQSYTPEAINLVLERLKNLKLVDDIAFAEYWKENRTRFKPCGRRMLKYELLRKGVDPATISEAVEETDELENALRAAKVKADRLPLIDFKLFSQKLSAYLQRRGFDYGVVSKIVKQAWQERTGDSGSDSVEDST